MTEEVDTMTSSNLQNKYPPVLCVRQMAEILVVSHNTAYELVRSGAIHSVRVGRNYRIPLEAVIDYLSKHWVVAERPHLWYNIGVPAMRQRKE